MGRKGFTAVELIVSLLIISVLMVGALPTLGVLKGVKDIEKDMIKSADEVSVKLGVSVFRILYGRFPSDLGELISSGVVVGDPGSYYLIYEEGVPKLR